MRQPRQCDSPPLALSHAALLRPAGVHANHSSSQLSLPEDSAGAAVCAATNMTVGEALVAIASHASASAQRKQLGNIQLECPRQLLDVVDRNVPLGPLNRPYERSMNARPIREFLLRDAPLRPLRSQSPR